MAKLNDEQIAAVVAIVVKELTKVLAEYEVTKKIEDKVKRIADKGLDLVEVKVAASKTKVDDVFVLPLCKMIRAAGNIPEYDS
jgi:hypothetical protein